MELNAVKIHESFDCMHYGYFILKLLSTTGVARRQRKTLDKANLLTDGNIYL